VVTTTTTSCSCWHLPLSASMYSMWHSLSIFSLTVRAASSIGKLADRRHLARNDIAIFVYCEIKLKWPFKHVAVETTWQSHTNIKMTTISCKCPVNHIRSTKQYARMQQESYMCVKKGVLKTYIKDTLTTASTAENCVKQCSDSGKRCISSMTTTHNNYFSCGHSIQYTNCVFKH